MPPAKFESVPFIASPTPTPRDASNAEIADETHDDKHFKPDFHHVTQRLVNRLVYLFVFLDLFIGAFCDFLAQKVDERERDYHNHD